MTRPGMLAILRRPAVKLEFLRGELVGQRMARSPRIITELERISELVHVNLLALNRHHTATLVGRQVAAQELSRISWDSSFCIFV